MMPRHLREEQLQSLIQDLGFTLLLPKRIELSQLPERMRFDIKLQISLRKNAINIMGHYEDKEKFRQYIREREEKIRILLNCSEDMTITENGESLFP